MTARVNLIVTALLIVLCLHNRVAAQEKTEVIQPSIIVVPYTDSLQPSIEKALRDPLRRLAIARAKEALEKAGLQPLDFVALYEKRKQEEAESLGDGGDGAAKEGDQRDVIARNAQADVRITLDLVPTTTSEGFSVRMLLSAVDPYTAKSIASVQEASRYQYMNDTARIVDKLLVDKVEEFKTRLQAAFTAILNEGRPYEVDVRVLNSSGLDMTKEMESGDELADVLCDYLKTLAYKGRCKCDKQKTSMIIRELRLPIREKDGNAFDMNDLEKNLKRYLKSLKLTGKWTVRTFGGRISVVLE